MQSVLAGETFPKAILDDSLTKGFSETYHFYALICLTSFREGHDRKQLNR
jgi:hypothetical protein